MIGDEERREVAFDAAMRRVRRERELKAAKECGAPTSSPCRLGMSEAQRAIMRTAEQIERTMIGIGDGWSELNQLKEISNG